MVIRNMLEQKMQATQKTFHTLPLHNAEDCDLCFVVMTSLTGKIHCVNYTTVFLNF